MLKIERILSVF